MTVTVSVPTILRSHTGGEKRVSATGTTLQAVISLTDTCQVAGLGGRGNRNGTFEYYMSERRVSNDPKGVAPFILAALEVERAVPLP